MIQHIVKTQPFTREFLSEIFSLTRDMRKLVLERGGSRELEGKLVATLFWEPSTRTRLSFEAATARLGASILSTESAEQFSSSAKGEILEDTIRVVSRYVDCIVLRHKEDDAADRAAHVSRVPIINGGSGKNQHPTQTLLDLFTIENEFGCIDGLSVALVGDLLNGRTIHSLAYLLGRFSNITLYLVAPDNLMMPSGIIEYLMRHKVNFLEQSDFGDIIPKIDVLYQTRIQKERFANSEEYETSKGRLIVSRELANQMKFGSIILHPLPRIDEIRYGVDDNHRAKYFDQAENGLYVRMALLKYLLGKGKSQ
jgi:aspartate carbamoyltransferase catalytic subunit